MKKTIIQLMAWFIAMTLLSNATVDALDLNLDHVDTEKHAGDASYNQESGILASHSYSEYEESMMISEAMVPDYYDNYPRKMDPFVLSDIEHDEFLQDLSDGLVTPMKTFYSIDDVRRYLYEKYNGVELSVDNLYDSVMLQDMSLNSDSSSWLTVNFSGTPPKTVDQVYPRVAEKLTPQYYSTIQGLSKYTKNGSNTIPINIYDTTIIIERTTKQQQIDIVMDSIPTFVVTIAGILAYPPAVVGEALLAAGAIATEEGQLIRKILAVSGSKYTVYRFRESSTYDHTYTRGNVELRQIAVSHDLRLSIDEYYSNNLPKSSIWDEPPYAFSECGNTDQGYADYAANLYLNNCNQDGFWSWGANCWDGLLNGVYFDPHECIYTGTLPYNNNWHVKKCYNGLTICDYHETHMYTNSCDTTCNDCGYTRTVSHSMEWGGNTSAHYKQCKNCTYKETASSHTYTDWENYWDYGLGISREYRWCTTCKLGIADQYRSHPLGAPYWIIEGSCTIAGTQARSCTTSGCMYYTQTQVAPLGHIYSNACDTTCNTTGCTVTRTITHNYTNNCDTSCNVCGYIRSITHSYTNNCDTSCNVCGYIRSITHSYTNNCDTSCNVCGYIRSITHSYTNNCDTSCNVCGVTRTITHIYTNVCDASCNVCGLTRTAPHSFAAATCTSPKKCTLCSTTTGSALGHTKGTLRTSTAATCTAAGSNTYRCNRVTSHDWGTVTVAKLGHDFNTYYSRVDVTNHQKNCARFSTCGIYTSRSTHNFGTGTSCTSGCGQSHGHTNGVWDKNTSSHWRKCGNTLCSYNFPSSSHSYGTGTSCTGGCGQTHTHHYGLTWSYDGRIHWKFCLTSGCSYKLSGEHFVTKSSGGKCATCGAAHFILDPLTIQIIDPE